MRKIIQKITSQNIETVDHVKNFITDVVHTLHIGRGFHPDTDFKDYVISGSESPMFSKVESKALDQKLGRCFDVCKKLDADIYGIAFDIFQTLYNNEMSEGEKES